MRKTNEEKQLEIAIRDQIRDIREYAWTGIHNPQDYDKKSPLANVTLEEFGVRLMECVCNPDYFYFTCKHILNREISPMQAAVLKELWVRPYPMLVAARGMGKTFILAVYCMLRLLLTPKTKFVICGAGFRQSKLVFGYMEEIWRSAPILRDICGSNNDQGFRKDTDQWSLRIGENIAVGIPIGDGSKIRGLRATNIIADEFGTINPEVFEYVIQGFTSVTASPIENMKREAFKARMKEMGYDYEDNEDYVRPNQSIVSGTAGYIFDNFGRYFQRYKGIVESKGDPDVLRVRLGKSLEEELDWRDFSVIRIPYSLIPKGFMDAKSIAKSRATINSIIFMQEYGATFVSDSMGFFRASTIQSCTVTADSPFFFCAGLEGSQVYKYVIGVDPASERDRFSIVVLELHENHRRIIYAWSVKRDEHRRAVRDGETDIDDYYAYCARVIRDLKKRFPAAAIGIDSEGGGRGVEEALHNSRYLVGSELPLWPIVEEKEKDCDGYPGEHILHMIKFSDSTWVSKANHGLKQDLEQKQLLFPYFDSVGLELAYLSDKASNRTADTLEQCLDEIEELKTELTTIVHTRTGTSERDKWDTPEIKEAGMKKGRLTKDRYSALLIANMVARQMQAESYEPNYEAAGGFAHNMREQKKGDAFSGPDWFNAYAKEFYG